MKKLLNENTKAFFYLVLGLFLSFNLTINVLDKITTEKEKDLVYLVTLQSCYFSTMKNVKDPSEEKLSEFCKKHAEVSKVNYEDISKQMDEITDAKYSVKNYFYKLIKGLF